MSEERAHARVSDPGTSHAAAAAVTPGLPTLQAMVERWALRRPEGFLDVDLTLAHPDLGPSTLRTRRSELGARNIIVDSGRRITPAGATTPHTVWLHRSFVFDPPPLLPPPETKAPTDDNRAARVAFAVKMDGYAKTAKAEGRSFLAAELTEAARLLRS
jgi:hypothetical protein